MTIWHDEMIAECDRIITEHDVEAARTFVEETCMELDNSGNKRAWDGIKTAENMQAMVGNVHYCPAFSDEEYICDVKTLRDRLETERKKLPSQPTIENNLVVNVTITIENIVDSVRDDNSLSVKQQDEIVSLLRDMRDNARRGNKKTFLEKLSAFTGLSADAATLVDILSKAMPSILAMLKTL